MRIESFGLLRFGIVGSLVLLASGCDDDNRRAAFAPYDVPNSVVIGDFNADGAPDLAVAATHVDGNFPNPGLVGVILQNRNTPGTFQPSIDITTNVFNPSVIVAADLNGAGAPDLAVANAYSGNVSVLINSATAGQFSPVENINVGGVPYDIDAGDLNGDGAVDLVVADDGQRTSVVVLTQDIANRGKFLAPALLAVGDRVTAVAVGDINGDGRNDIATTSQNSFGAGQVSLFLQDPANPGQFLPRVDLSAGPEPLSVKIGDLDGDGRADLAIANEGPGYGVIGSAGVSVLLQNPAQAGTFFAPVTYATGRSSVCVTIGDLNGDGRPDLAVANAGGWRGSVSVLLQDSVRPGVFLSAVNYSGVYEPLGLAIGDLNGDGRSDIAVADGDRATIMLQSSTAPGTFAAPVLVGK